MARPTLPLVATITCQDCATQRQRCPANTRYCKPCRLLRELYYWQRRRRACQNCNAEFAPLNRNDMHCSACDRGLAPYAGRCISCADEQGWPAVKDIPVCAPCMRNPRKRALIISALERGQTKRKATNA